MEGEGENRETGRKVFEMGFGDGWKDVRVREELQRKKLREKAGCRA